MAGHGRSGDTTRRDSDRKSRGRTASELRGIARFKIHEGRLKEFTRVSARCMEIVRTQEALIEHTAHRGDRMEAIPATGLVTGEFFGEPSVGLRMRTSRLDDSR